MAAREQVGQIVNNKEKSILRRIKSSPIIAGKRIRYQKILGVVVAGNRIRFVEVGSQAGTEEHQHIRWAGVRALKIRWAEQG